MGLTDNYNKGEPAMETILELQPGREGVVRKTSNHSTSINAQLTCPFCIARVPLATFPCNITICGRAPSPELQVGSKPLTECYLSYLQHQRHAHTLPPFVPKASTKLQVFICRPKPMILELSLANLWQPLPLPPHCYSR